MGNNNKKTILRCEYNKKNERQIMKKDDIRILKDSRIKKNDSNSNDLKKRNERKERGGNVFLFIRLW